MLYILKDGLRETADSLTPKNLTAAHAAWGYGFADGTWRADSINGHAVLEYAPALEETGRELEDAGRILVCGASTSSLDAARLLTTDGTMREWDSVLAVTQRAGRGQLRRPWSSPAGNIHGALRMPFGQAHLDDFAPLTLGYLFAEAFGTLGIQVSLKWPNDLLLQGGKVGGVLLEEVGGALFAGVGINLVASPPVGDLRDGWAVPACNLADAGFEFSVTTLWQTLVNRIRFCYETQVVRYNREELTRRVQKYLAWVGRDVIIHGGDAEFRPGRLLGVNENGALRLLLSGQEVVIHSGSISLSPHRDPAKV
ncbi:biotin--[acetyl-CoA-carboxylase] ligase [Desulfovibrio psychrotolerans]|uniref:Biotin--acetyl-CoA-carboxylase ligase n=1 Tax=Desulfovibrio psychrotolerans TaxID=415242 RepID=A0A7J0BP31_9BACT|nr:biotin--[acetyl-CoA-carboxylase] ligase [Desulfovibrio psychrotolerans]GFM35453.1 biotin--acetyl-CoA-carboxylase ligase [Desulfovibrio psychrotolerans]